MPKLNFCDTGLVCWLPGIRTSDQLRAHPLRGPIFETWVTSEIAKRRANQGEFAGISHCRDRNGVEADPMVERPGGIIQPVSRRQPRSPTPRPFGFSMLHPRHPWRRPTPAPENGHTAPLAGYARVRQGRTGLQRARRDHRQRLSKETTSSRSSPTDHAQKRYGHTRQHSAHPTMPCRGGGLRHTVERAWKPANGPCAIDMRTVIFADGPECAPALRDLPN